MAPPPTGLPKISHAQPQPDDTGKGTLPLRPPPVSTGQAEAERAATEEHAADLIRPLDTQQKAMLTASAGQAASKGLATTNIRQPDAQQRAEQAASRKHAAATIRQPETWHGAPPATSAEEAVAPTGLQHEAQREAEPAAAKEPPVSLERSSAHSQQAVALAGASKWRPGGGERPSPHKRQLEARLEAAQGTAARGERRLGLQRSSGRRRQAEGLHRLSHGGRHGRHEHRHQYSHRWAVSGGWGAHVAACLAGSCQACRLND